MKTQTGLVIGGILLVGVIVWVLTRPAAKASAAPSTSNNILQSATGLVSALGKLIPASAYAGPKSSGAGIPNNPGLDYQETYPGDNESGTGVMDGGT